MTKVILPGATIGVVGGGQLGRMLALEARRMGYRVRVLDPGENGPAAQVADEHVRAPLDDHDAIAELARGSDVVTLEWENADVATLRTIEESVPVRPGAHVLEVAQHRVREKSEARRLGLDTVDFNAVNTLDDLSAAIRDIGTPSVLKTARGGYDGKGQVVLRSPADADAAFAELGGGDRELILEKWMDFRLEASVVCARSAAGEIATYPIGENIHSNGILDITIIPARMPDRLHAEARRIGEALVEGLDVVGILAVELFIGDDETIAVNEIAPRPHNSGHYTWDACAVSQFEQQLRSVCGLPLGSTGLLRPAAMVNLLGEHIGTGEDLAGTVGALGSPMTSLHLYGKREGRVGRKMGHLTALGDTVDEAFQRASDARDALTESYERGAGRE
ncbi:MAG TPA: 5-(carboxyamino)imidazole ribonucleotide synthase [Longimicrobiaceae bacterium]|nr:5-(carboxyamino)imidazole ribonucleotide synthase [Longimicrobiaceae bacterium]